MANDRLSLVCPYCKGRITLFKHLAQEWYTPFDDMTKLLDEFGKKHFECYIQNVDFDSFKCLPDEERWRAEDKARKFLLLNEFEEGDLE